MALQGWGFEGQNTTPGSNTPTIANSDDFGDPAWTVVSSGGFLTYVNSPVFTGSVALAVKVTTAATATNLEKSDTASANAAASVNLFLNAYPSVDMQAPVGFRGSSTALARMNISPTGQLKCTIGGTTSTASASVLSLSTWYRLEVSATGFGTAASAIQCDVYLSGTNTLVFSANGLTGQTTASQIDAVRWTKFGGSTNSDFILDDPWQNVGGTTTRTTVSSDLDLRWASRAQVSSDVDLRWLSRAQVSSDLDLRWAVRAQVSSSLDLRWFSASGAVTVPSDLDLRWLSRSQTTSDADLRWAVRAAVTSASDVRWIVRTLVTSDTDTRWAVRAVLAADLSTLWRVRGVATSDSDVRWRVLAALAADLDLRWVNSGVVQATGAVVFTGSPAGPFSAQGSPAPVAQAQAGTTAGPIAIGG